MTKLDLRKLIDHINIAELLSEQELSEIGSTALNEYKYDLASRSEWEAKIDEGMKLAKQIKEEKSSPWPDASNIKYPSITTASIQFAARAYAEIVKNDRIAGCKVIGEDQDGHKQDRADRISKFLDYQLTDQIEGWECDTDRLLHVLPITGICWKKIYFDSIDGPRSDFIMPKDVVVHYYTKSLLKCPRITHVFPLYQNDIVTKQRGGEYLDIELGAGTPSGEYDGTPTDAQHIFLEQHRWIDLDGDGYKEPYIVTMLEETGQVVRIVARFDQNGIMMNKGKVMFIKPIIYFEKYGFIPAPDGSFYDIGFGSLLSALNAGINTAFNQLFDSGTLQNTGGGFLAKGARMNGGSVRFRPGEWKPVEVSGGTLRDAIVPLPQTQPSQVLFNLLSLLIDTTKELSTVSAEMTGGQTSPNEPATSMLARLEQGMKVFNSIHKRVYRSLTGEINKIYELDRQYLTPEFYASVVDDPEANFEADFEDKAIDIKPICDPTMSTDAQKTLKLQAAGQILASTPGADMREYAKRVLNTIGIENIDALLPEPDPNQQPPPDPAVMQQQAQMQLDKANLQKEAEKMKNDLQLAMKKMQMDMMNSHAEMNLKAQQQKNALKLEWEKLVLEREKLAFAMGKLVMDTQQAENIDDVPGENDEQTNIGIE